MRAGVGPSPAKESTGKRSISARQLLQPLLLVLVLLLHLCVEPPY